MRTSRPGTAPPGKASHKERILIALTKLNDRDTQKHAAEDLLRLVTDMDQEGLPLLASAICGTGSEQKPYARKECARLLGRMCSGDCPVREQALQAPHLPRFTTQLKKALQDPDSGVRDAGAEALALVARGLAETGGTAAAAPAVRAMFDGLAEQNKEMQVAACCSLGLAAPYIGQLEMSLVKELVRRLGSPTFHAQAALLAALGRLDGTTHDTQGLIKFGPGAFQPVLGAVVGHLPTAPVSGSSSSSSSHGAGILSSLGSKDWQARRAAADCLKACALVLGPMMEPEGVWAPAAAGSLTGRCVRGLETCRHDKVKDVRDTAREALQVLDVLQQYSEAGGGTGGWAAHAAEALAARGIRVSSTAPEQAEAPLNVNTRRSSSPRRLSPPPLMRSADTTSPPRNRTSPFERQGSVSERFRQAHEVAGDVVRDPSMRPDRMASPPPAQRSTAAPAAAQGPDVPQLQAAPRTSLSGAPPPAVPRTSSSGAAAPPPARPPSAAGAAPSRHTQRVDSRTRTSSRDGSAAYPHSGGGAPPDPPPAPAEAPPAAPDRVRPGLDSSSRRPSLNARASATEALAGIASTAASTAAAIAAVTAARDAAVEPVVPQFQVRPSLQPSSRAEEGGTKPDAEATPELTPLQKARAARHSARVERQALTPSTSATSSPTTAPAAPYTAPSAIPSSAPMAAVPTGVSQAPMIQVSSAAWSQLQSQVVSLQAQQQQLLETLANERDGSAKVITGLQARVHALEAAAAVRGGSGAGTAASNGGARSLSPAPSMPRVDGAAGQRGAPTLVVPPMQSPTPPRQRPQSAVPVHLREMWLPSAGPISPTAPDSRAQSPFGAAGTPGNTTPSTSQGLESAYCEALSTGRRGDMHLLRLMQRTGCVWDTLEHATAMALLAQFVLYVQEGTFIPKILPWLFRLADENATQMSVPRPMQLQLVAALSSSPAASGTGPLEEQEKVRQLTATLRSFWGLSTQDGSPAVSSSTHSSLASRRSTSNSPEVWATPAQMTPPSSGAMPMGSTPLASVVDAAPLPASGSGFSSTTSFERAHQMLQSESSGPPALPAAAPAATSGAAPAAGSSPYHRQSLENLDQLKGKIERLQRDFVAQSPARLSRR